MDAIERSEYDAIVIGGGFYGSNVAIHLKEIHGLKNILLIEAEPELLSRASRNNQARIHEGYHYPRSFTTAFRSRINSSIFKTKWEQSVVGVEDAYYAIASRNSKVSKSQFIRFCDKIGATIKVASQNVKSQFNETLIDEVFSIQEDVFDYRILKKLVERQIIDHKINVIFNTKVSQVIENPNNSLTLYALTQEQKVVECVSNFVFNCTYSGLSSISTTFLDEPIALKHELTEMALVKVPNNLNFSSITVMDGPFFSLMPYPARPGLHTLSHVRYTPHTSWLDENSDINPYEILKENRDSSRFERMKRDASRYIPGLKNLEWVDSINEIKTVLVQNEIDDGRPILFRTQGTNKNYISILGGKIDNVFDVLAILENQKFKD